MTRYLISFDDAAMTFPEEELPAVGEAAQAWSELPSRQGCGSSVTGWNTRGRASSPQTGRSPTAPYPETKAVIGGFAMVDVPLREKALEWAAKFAVACRCAEEVREIMFDRLV
jgi:hypothetical protein